MKIPITQKMLMDWAGARVYHYGKTLFDERRVLSVQYDHPVVTGTLDHGPRGLNCRFELLQDGQVDNQCPCRDCQERGIICSHVVAVAMELIRRNTDPERGQKALEEERRAQRLASFTESDYIRRVRPGTIGAVPAALLLSLDADWRTQLAAEQVGLTTELLCGKERIPIGDAATDVPFVFSKQDENLLFVLEDIAEGPHKTHLLLSMSDWINLLELLRGKKIYQAGDPAPIVVRDTRITSSLQMDMDRDSGELILSVHAGLPDSASEVCHIVSQKRGWVYADHQLWPLDNVLPLPLHGIYRQPIRIERKGVPHFIKTELPLIASHIVVNTEITEEMFQLEPAAPRFKLCVRGSPASLAFTLLACYGDLELVAAKPEAVGAFALPDPDDIMRYLVRNLPGEQDALGRLAEIGIAGERGDQLAPVVGCNQVLAFLGSTMPRLHRLGWKVELEGPVQPFMNELQFALPVVRVAPTPGNAWFEVGFEFEDQEGESLSSAEIQRAMNKGESFVERKGRNILLDMDAIESARRVFEDCSSGDGVRPGTFRMGNIHSAYVQSALHALDGVDVEAPPEWLRDTARHNRQEQIEPIPLSWHAERILRPYQKEGVYWLNYLSRQGFCGILADEMGLGKTLQALLWMELLHRRPQMAGHPCLVVCPTSLVENWAEEAARFTPDFQVLVMSGAERHKRWGDLRSFHLVITSYALIRRDIEMYRAIEFSAIILDEAQHIKNQSTQNAVAAKQLRASHRLVLTGTPVENSVADLWSIMDFLMPGYLCSYKTFRENYELAIARGGSDAESAQARLRRKLHPFLLRRLKKDVAKDLPPKIERLISCSLSKDQQLVYNQMLQASRNKIFSMVQQKGFNHSRMEILKVLLRLRQICCHLDLIKLPDLNSTHPSAKMDLFFELFDEALDGGHRILVFSQFTSMLAILRRELESRGREFCYLDGATKDRMNVVRTFNANHTIPAFLISLKAGGTGLNLTGADMVIHYDPWWNPAVEDQATDRAYRIGQKRTVYSVKMITRGTVEEKVLAMQKKKKTVINATLGDDSAMTSAITWDDVQELLAD